MKHDPIEDGQDEPDVSIVVPAYRSADCLEALTEAVERLSGRRVIAFMSQTHVDPDFGVEAFVLEPVEALPNARATVYPPAA